MIITRAIQFEKEVTEEQRRHRYQRTLTTTRLPLIQDWMLKGTVDAYVNDSRWLARCPVPDCNGCEYVDPDWPVFVCSGGCGAGPFDVAFPAEREQIEAELDKRPVPRTRAWRKGETVADLRRENKDHGLD